MEKITAVNSLLNFLIEDTEAGLLTWESYIEEYVIVFIVDFKIKKTCKSLNFKVYAIGNKSYIKVSYYIHPDVVIPFEKIEHKECPKEIDKLIKTLYKVR